MAKIALSKIALVDNTTKLKHWTQAIKELELEISDIKENLVPKNHACIYNTFGEGSEHYYGHVKLLDDLSYNFTPKATGLFWELALPKTTSNVDLADGSWKDITYHAGILVAVGSHGRIITSKDGGKTWGTVQFIDGVQGTLHSNANYCLNAVKWCGNCFVAVGNYNTFVYSFDGSLWSSPLYVGSSYINDSDDPVSKNVITSFNSAPQFTKNDAWYDIVYDTLSNLIILCGSQGRTLFCKFKTGTENGFVFSATQYNLNPENYDNFREVNFYSGNIITENEESRVVICGSQNYVINCALTRRTAIDSFGNIINLNTSEPIILDIQVIQDVYQVINTRNNTPFDWKDVSVQDNENQTFDDSGYNKLFVLIGENGNAIISYTGKYNAWTVPQYSAGNYGERIRNTLNTQVKYHNLTVVGAEYISLNEPNIIRYDDNIKSENITIFDVYDGINLQHTVNGKIKINGVVYTISESDTNEYVITYVSSDNITTTKGTVSGKVSINGVEYTITLNDDEYKLSSLNGTQTTTNKEITISGVVYTISNANPSEFCLSYFDNTNDINIVKVTSNGKIKLISGGTTDEPIITEYTISVSSLNGLQTEIESADNIDDGQTNIVEIRHQTDKQYMENDVSVNVDCSWYGSCYAKDRFFLVGSKNTIICSTINEDTNSYAISLAFYRKYIKILEDRINELESNVIKTDLVYNLISGDDYDYDNPTEDTSDTEIAYESISYINDNTLLFNTEGRIQIDFQNAPPSVYKEIIIYLTALKDTRLRITGAEWENDLYMADWGKGPRLVNDPNDPTKQILLTYHLTLKAIFVGGRVIVQVIDNDQLADNLGYDYIGYGN